MMQHTIQQYQYNVHPCRPDMSQTFETQKQMLSSGSHWLGVKPPHSPPPRQELDKIPAAVSTAYLPRIYRVSTKC